MSQSAALAHLECYLDVNTDLVFSVDADGTFQHSSDSFRKLLGYTEVELAALTLYDLVTPESRRYLAGAYRRALTGAPISGIEATFVSRSGLYFVLEGSASACRVHPHPVHVRGIYKDITLRKEADDAMARHVEELTRSNLELEQLAYVAAHDMQEPLRMISSYLGLIARRYKGRLDSDADTFIEFAVDGANRMNQMIKDLLASAKLVYSGRMQQPVEMDHVLARVTASLGHAIADAGGEVTWEPLPTVAGNPIQLTQLMQNLITNALKYHRPEVPPRVHVAAEELRAHWSFTVTDNGAGIPLDQTEQVFRLFGRGSARGRVPGSGIGLAVARKIVERHGGQIRVKPNPGGGSIFSFTLAKTTTEVWSEPAHPR